MYEDSAEAETVVLDRDQARVLLVPPLGRIDRVRLHLALFFEAFAEWLMP